jgi:hypothetical protein
MKHRFAQRSRSTIALIATLGLLIGVVPALTAVATPAAPAAAVVASDFHAETGVVRAADLSLFQSGNIIADAVFFNRDTMTEAQIQTFLEQRVPRCEAGYTCLKDWYDTSRTTNPDAMCGGYSGGMRERASRIIYRVAQACGINPQVILATLQKEQGLVNHVWPSDWRYTIAMGQGCPDTAACDTRYYGFFNQVYGAAWQLKRYANPPGTSQYFTWYAPGKTWNVRWHPNAACGSSPVHIQNQATANLYYYTPYQPNAAALRAGYGEGDGCSSYGNRNFFQYFTDWFGSTQAPNPCQPPPDSQVTPASGEYMVNVASLNARKAPTQSCGEGVVSLAQGTKVLKLGEYGSWWKVSVNGVAYWVASEYLLYVTPKDVDSFLQAVYIDVLGRQAGTGERAGWGQAIANGMPRLQVVYGFVNSDEFRMLKITEAYREVLGRAPEDGGMTAWLNGMRGGVLAPDDAYRAFLRSDEYYMLTGGTDARFVAAVYEKILHRAAGQEEIEGWSRVVAAVGRAAVVDSIWTSVETARARVAVMYRAYLGREPDQAALEGWGDHDLRYGHNAVRMGILGSAEYQSRAAARFP